MEKPTFKLVGAPCGQHGQYTFYKALRLSTPRDHILAIGDFFFVRIWQDSELVSIGELQLLWTDRVSDQTLVSLRLYFLPENTPDGRNQHGEDEVLALNEKVVVRAEDLLSWICSGSTFRVGLRAVWRGACAPPPHSAPLHTSKLDFSDVDTEKSAIEEDINAPGVVVFSYPRYCRYRAILARLEGLQGDWLRDSLVAALGGYAASTTNTTILYCKDTFEYPELEGHEFVVNHMAPRLKGRPRGRRRRAPSRSHSPSSRSSDSDHSAAQRVKVLPRRLSLRASAVDKDKQSSSEDDVKQSPSDVDFHRQLRQFYSDRTIIPAGTRALKHLSLRTLYESVSSLGGYEVVCRSKLWRAVHADRPARVRSVYEKFLLPFENHERQSCRKPNGKLDDKIDTIDVPDSPRSPAKKEEIDITSRPAEELNREFLESLPKEEKPVISIKPVHQLIETDKQTVQLHDGHAPLRNTTTGVTESSLIQELNKQPSPDALTSLSALGDKYVNGHAASPDQKSTRPLGRSSLRAVRVKPTRPQHTAANTPPITNSASSSPPQRLRPPTQNSDDEIVEVPYKPKTPEIIDLDEYPESPQSAKKKKLDILKERGLEVTALPPTWGPVINPMISMPNMNTPPIMLNPAMQHQIMTQASLFQMYNIIPQNYANGIQPPRVIQSSSIYGTNGPEKIVYGNPKDPFMPPPHILLGVPVKPKIVSTDKEVRQDILDLTCKTSVSPVPKPAVEIVRLPNVSPKSSAQNLSKNYTLIDGKAVVGSNLEITLVSPKSHTPPKNRPPQKRSSNGKFVSTKTPTPPKLYPSPSGLKTVSPTLKKPAINIPNYSLNRDEVSPTSSTGSRDSLYKPQNFQPIDKSQPIDPKIPIDHKGSMIDMQKNMPVPPFVDPMYMSALYSSLAGQIDQRQLAMYRDLMASQFRYSSLLGGVGTPTTKN